MTDRHSKFWHFARESKYTVPPWSESDTAYIAGIIDGEGCIGIYHYKSRSSIHPVISVTNTSKALIDWICLMLGLPSGKYVAHCQAGCRQWYTTKTGPMQQTYEVATRVLPYLRVKRKQAELLIRYCDWRRLVELNGRDTRGRIAGFSPDQRAYINDILAEIRQLNRKGTPISTPIMKE